MSRAWVGVAFGVKLRSFSCLISDNYLEFSLDFIPLDSQRGTLCIKISIILYHKHGETTSRRTIGKILAFPGEMAGNDRERQVETGHIYII